ncbi:hypothetical protein TNCV_2452691 [Trichonephila clavipes]|nr:hypothetical protein TNCV_2452691 [Trichonephila clavipes]
MQSLKSAARLVHGIGIRKTSVCSKYCTTNSAAEDYKACRKFRLFVKDRTTNLHFLPTGLLKARQLDSKKLEIAKQEFKFMLDNDILRPSKSPWASPTTSCE